MSNIGRPRLFSSPEELEQKIQAYFCDCDPHISRKLAEIKLPDGSLVIREIEYMTEQIPYTVTGLARSLGTSRRTLLNYQNRNEDFFHTVTRAKQDVEVFWELALHSPGKAPGAMFTLRNNFGWNSKSKVDNTYPQAI